MYSDIYKQIVGFTQLDFYPHIAAPFLQKLALKIFVEGYNLDFILGNLLLEEQNLGRNTNVAVMDSHMGRRFFLCSHALSHPLGVAIPPQCPGCGRIHTSKWNTHPPQDHFTLHISCKFCPHMYQLQPRIDDYFTLPILHGKEGWGIGLYWGPYMDYFPNGMEAYSRGDAEEEVADFLKAEKSKEYYAKLEAGRVKEKIN